MENTSKGNESPLKIVTFKVEDNSMNMIGVGKCYQGFDSKGDYILIDAGGNKYINGKLQVVK